MAKSNKKPTAAAAAAKKAKSPCKSRGCGPKASTKPNGAVSKPIAKAAAKPATKSAAAKPVAKSAATAKPVAKPTATSKSAATARLAAKPVPSAKSSGRPGSKSKPAAAAPAVTGPVKLIVKNAAPKLSGRASSGPKIGSMMPAKPIAPPVEAPVAPIKVRPGKNQAGLTSRELEFFRDLLLAKRRELVGDMSSMEREALTRSGENLSNLPIHMADMGTDNYEQEFTLGLMEKDRQLLREINSALRKIEDGSYGICEGTGKPISKGRLEVAPWARYSIEHARKLESRGIRQQ